VVKTTRFDEVKFRSDHPDLHAQYMRESGYRKAVLKKGTIAPQLPETVDDSGADRVADDVPSADSNGVSRRSVQ
jgi:hypothetical protein